MAIPPTASQGVWLSPRDAAAILGSGDVSRVSKLAKKGRVRSKKLNSQRQLYHKADVLKLAETRKKKGKAGSKRLKSKTGPAGVKKLSSTAPTDKKWLTVSEAATLANLTKSGLQSAARRGHIKRRKTNSGYRYLSADIVTYTKAHPLSTKTKPPVQLPEKFLSRRRQSRQPKQANAALTKARWVFEGMEIGAIPETAALDILRSIVYEGSNQ